MSKPSSPAQLIANAVQQRLRRSDPELGRIIAEELAAVLGDAGGGEIPLNDLARSQNASEGSRVVVTAHGRNRSGIVAALASAIDQFDGDIRDLSQTIVGDYFTMLFVVDLAQATPEGARFAQLRHRLKEVGDDMGVHVVVMHDDILTAMHSI